MTFIPFILLFAGLLLIYFEFYMPGGILGTLGGIVVVASVVVFATETDSFLALFLFIVFTIACLTILIKYTLQRIRNSKQEYSIYSNDAQEGYRSYKYDETAIGKTGEVVSDLKPGGNVIVNGKKHDAISQSGYLKKGVKVEVVGGEGESLIVKIKKD